VIWTPLPGRVAVVEAFERSPLIHRVDGYDKTHERERKCHRGRVVAMGAPAQTRSGAPILPGFAVGDDVLYVLDKLSEVTTTHEGSWCEKARENVWPPTGENVIWVAAEEIIGVFDLAAATEHVA
jgi:co-chaperonin GroES (HSP10)